MADNLYGAYKPHRSKDDIWYHGPIMWKGKQKKVPVGFFRVILFLHILWTKNLTSKKQKLANVVHDEMVFIGDRNIYGWKNGHNQGVTGYYDLVQGRSMESTVEYFIKLLRSEILSPTCFTLLGILLALSSRTPLFTELVKDGLSARWKTRNGWNHK